MEAEFTDPGALDDESARLWDEFWATVAEDNRAASTSIRGYDLRNIVSTHIQPILRTEERNSRTHLMSLIVEDAPLVDDFGANTLLALIASACPDILRFSIAGSYKSRTPIRRRLERDALHGLAQVLTKLTSGPDARPEAAQELRYAASMSALRTYWIDACIAGDRVSAEYFVCLIAEVIRTALHHVALRDLPCLQVRTMVPRRHKVSASPRRPRGPNSAVELSAQVQLREAVLI